VSSHGIARERQVRVLLNEMGYWTSRAAGSLGDADIIALRALEAPEPAAYPGTEALLVEVKSTAQGPYEHFGPAERAQLVAAARKAGAAAVLCWWPKRRQPVWIPEASWPV
jgi:Holliday junction resolvase